MADLAVIPQGPALPALVAAHGDRGAERFLEFFAAQIRNPNTREAYARAVGRFLDWSQDQGATALGQIRPMHVAAYIEGHPGSPASVKQHLAAIRMLFDWLVTGGIIESNPASSVRGPRVAQTRGKTPILSVEEARALFDAIPLDTPAGLRDRALIGVLLYSFARISAALGMAVADAYTERSRLWFRLHEKGGVFHAVPAHHLAEEYIRDYLAALPSPEPKSPLFRALDRSRQLSDRALDRTDALRMIRRRAKAAGIETPISPHSFRATGITLFRANGGALDKAQQLAAHADPKTTRLYDRSSDPLTLDEVERIRI